MKSIAPAALPVALVLALVLALCLTTPALADDHGSDDDGPFVTAGFQSVAKAEFDDGTGEVGLSTAYVEGGFEWLSVAYARTDYSWTNVDELPFGNRADDPWDTLHVLAISSDHDGMFDDTWGWFAGAGVGAAYEDEMDGAWGWSGHGGGIYALNEHVFFSFGLGLGGHKTGFEAMPLFGVNWDYVDVNGSGWYGVLGIPETNVGYAFSKEFSLTLELEGGGSTYRLADDSTVEREGYVETDEMSLALAAVWSPWENVSLELAPSYHFNRSMTIYEKNGDKDKTHDLDAAVGVSLGLSVAF